MSDPATPPAPSRVDALINKLWTDKDVGHVVRAKAKELFPDVVTPEDNPALAPVLAQLEEATGAMKAMREEMDAAKKAREEADAATAFKAGVHSASTGLTEAGRELMLKHMDETKNYTDFEGAAAWVAAQEPKPKTTGPTFGPQAMDLFGSKNKNDSLAQLHNDPEGFQDAVLNEFFNDPDKFVRETLAA